MPNEGKCFCSISSLQQPAISYDFISKKYGSDRVSSLTILFGLVVCDWLKGFFHPFEMSLRSASSDGSLCTTDVLSGGSTFTFSSGSTSITILQISSSAHSEAEYGWPTDDNLICDDSTFIRAIKKIATSKGSDGQLTFEDFEDDDSMAEIDQVRDAIMTAFNAATENIINSIRGDDSFDSRQTVSAIDITHEQFHVWPWEDKEAGIAKPDCPKMVSGYKKDGEYKRGYKYATITLVGDHAPIVLGIEPVKENSAWEPDCSPSYSKADLVSRLFDRAE